MMSAGTAGASDLRPLSFAQERLFLLDRLMPGSAAYNVPTLVRIDLTLDEGLVQQAFDLIVERHQILRTRLGLHDDTPAQEVFAAPPFELRVIDLRSIPRDRAQSEANDRLADLVGQPFDLRGDVLVRAALVHLAADEDWLLVVFHHMASDHLSGRLLFAELDAAYTALAAGLKPSLPALPTQYADFAARQREQLNDEALEELIAYWTMTLAGAPERLDLPSDRSRPAVQSHAGSWKEWTIPADRVAPLRVLARDQAASLYMVLLAAFNALLHRYTGAEDLVVGAPVSGRHDEGISSLLGFFSNTLALRVDVSGDPSFAELLARVKETTLEALAYQELPFEKLVEVINPQRAQSHSPIFQVLFGYDVAAKGPLTLAGQPLERRPVPGWAWSRFDLSIVLRDLPDGSLHADIEYATDLFDESTIERMTGHFETLLRAIGETPSTPVSALPLLTESERRQMLVEWNATESEPEPGCLHELFSAQARRTPDAVAVVGEEDRLTYRQLELESHRLARELVARGVTPGKLVGVCLERSPALVVALLAVLKTGAGYVPIEPTYPPQRQEFILADASVPLLITEERFVDVIDPRGGDVLCIDGERERIDANPAEPVAVDADPDGLAYVIYTSGSTGQPKGVEVSHRAVVNLISHMTRAPGIGAGDVVANVTTPAFDLSVPDWYLPLSTGASLVIVPREATLDGVALADWLVRAGVTFMQATPTTWQLLIDSGWTGNPDLKVVCGGEALSEALARELALRGAALWHMYGPTETTVWSSVLELADRAGPPVLGGPIANTSFYVLDRNRQPVPIGVPGELYIGGAGVAAGYHDRPQLTDEKFVRNPLDRQSQGRLYRTGDLVRWRGDGTLEFCGRIDHQVKLRGFRIELGEIEAVLMTHPSVRSAAAAVRDFGPDDRRLVGYVVPASGVADHEALRVLLRTKLPPYMIPSTFVTLDSLPVSANGKLDRGRLPLPDAASVQRKRSYSAPETPVQEALTTIWTEVLGVKRVGIDDDFFELGGHSLLAVKMLARVQEDLGVGLGLGGMFTRSTIRDLSEDVMLALLGDATEDELAGMLAG